MENISSIILDLREQIQALPLSKSGKRMGISLELRRSIVSAYSSSGLNREKFCGEVGVSCSGFAKWKRELNGKSSELKISGFKKVTVDPPKITALNDKVGLVIEGPHGLRISGLSMSDICSLWRSLC